jgi:RNA polymerase sigma-70 factor (ECF subfamily)
MSIPAWINEAKNGSRAAEKCLFDFYAEKMMLVCCRYLKNREDAEEVLLDGFYKFFKNIGTFHYQHDAAVTAFLKKIMVNECLMLLRKKNVFTIVSDTIPEVISGNDDALSNLTATEILQLIIQLPVGYRTVFNLHAIEGIEHQEIAEMLGISAGTSKSQLSKARALLQKMVAQKGITYARQKSR